jgi:hypothetical protein
MTLTASTAVRCGWGGLLLLFPAPVLRAASDAPTGGTAVLCARLLGVRHLLQAALTRRSPGPGTPGWGAAADAAHAATMATVALESRQWRRAGLADMVVAGSLSCATACEAGRRSMR